MKNITENTAEVLNYLTKTSEHVFVYPTNDKFMRLIEVNAKTGGPIWLVLEINTEFEVTKISNIIDIEYRSIDGNTKNCIKHELFLNKELRGVRLKKKTNILACQAKEIAKQLEYPKTWSERQTFGANILRNLPKLVV